MKTFKLLLILITFTFLTTSWGSQNKTQVDLNVEYTITNDGGDKTLNINILNGIAPYDVFFNSRDEKVELKKQPSNLKIPNLKKGEYVLVCQDKNKKLFFAPIVID